MEGVRGDQQDPGHQGPHTRGWPVRPRRRYAMPQPGFTIKLKKDVPLDEITDMIRSANEWVKVVPNDKESTIHDLTPAAVSGTLTVPDWKDQEDAHGPAVSDRLLLRRSAALGCGGTPEKDAPHLIEHLG